MEWEKSHSLQTPDLIEQYSFISRTKKRLSSVFAPFIDTHIDAYGSVFVHVTP